MPRSGSRKPLISGQYNRHLDEMRSLLHALDHRFDGENEGNVAAAMDVYETESEVILEFDLPGLAPENISIIQRGMVMTISADKLPDPAQEQLRYLCLERHFGRMRRTVRLPDMIDPARVHAEYRRGMLRIICPKARERRIAIKELQGE